MNFICAVLAVFPWLASGQTVQTVQERFAPPAPYVRIAKEQGSFAQWLGTLPVKPGNPPVHLYNGSLKSNQDAHAAVLDIDVGTRDLQQCADAVIRLRAEYLFASDNREAIRFDFTSGDAAEYIRWKEGYRPIVRGNQVRWIQSAATDDSYHAFRSYLNTVFTYSGSYSLSRELLPVETTHMLPGDVFIQGGFPGHAVIVVDMAEDVASGNRIFLLAQSYMPAQEIHILKNPSNSRLSPWYTLDSGETLETPEWTFRKADLRRFRRQEPGGTR